MARRLPTTTAQPGAQAKGEVLVLVVGAGVGVGAATDPSRVTTANRMPMRLNSSTTVGISIVCDT